MAGPIPVKVDGSIWCRLVKSDFEVPAEVDSKRPLFWGIENPHQRYSKAASEISSGVPILGYQRLRDPAARGSLKCNDREETWNEYSVSLSYAVGCVSESVQKVLTIAWWNETNRLTQASAQIPSTSGVIYVFRVAKVFWGKVERKSYFFFLRSSP